MLDPLWMSQKCVHKLLLPIVMYYPSNRLDWLVEIREISVRIGNVIYTFSLGYI
jgi:hypothetical protein